MLRNYESSYYESSYAVTPTSCTSLSLHGYQGQVLASQWCRNSMYRFGMKPDQHCCISQIHCFMVTTEGFQHTGAELILRMQFNGPCTDFRAVAEDGCDKGQPDS